MTRVTQLPGRRPYLAAFTKAKTDLPSRRAARGERGTHLIAALAGGGGESERGQAGEGGSDRRGLVTRSGTGTDAGAREPDS